MIRIPCRACGEVLELPQELAGTEFQCPQCHLLNDVPTLAGLRQIRDDGTYVFDESAPAEDPYRLAEMLHVFGRKVDEQGDEIDLRERTAAEEHLYRPAHEGRVAPPPRYDPETGELILPLDVKVDPSREPIDLASIPFASPALGYADRGTERSVSPGSIFAGLLRPTNLLVMLLVYLLHVIAAISLLACSYLNYFLGTPFMLILLLMLIGHWGNVIDETGPREVDELPRPFRDMQWYEDLIQPLGAFGLALLLCCLPERILLYFIHDPKVALLAALPFALASTYFFPAIFMIASSSGTILNLRPDRIWGTTVKAGASYAIAVLLWTIGGSLYLFCLVMMLFAATPLWWQSASQRPSWMMWWMTDARVGLLVLAPAIYFMHYFCWTMGLIYRDGHVRFPWVFQFHNRRRDDLRPTPASAPRKRRLKAVPPAPPAADWPQIHD